MRVVGACIYDRKTLEKLAAKGKRPDLSVAGLGLFTKAGVATVERNAAAGADLETAS